MAWERAWRSSYFAEVKVRQIARVTTRAPLVKAGRPRSGFQAIRGGFPRLCCETVKEPKCLAWYFQNLIHSRFFSSDLSAHANVCLSRRGVGFARRFSSVALQSRRVLHHIDGDLGAAVSDLILAGLIGEIHAQRIQRQVDLRQQSCLQLHPRFLPELHLKNRFLHAHATRGAGFRRPPQPAHSSRVLPS